MLWIFSILRGTGSSRRAGTFGSEMALLISLLLFKFQTHLAEISKAKEKESVRLTQRLLVWSAIFMNSLLAHAGIN